MTPHVVLKNGLPRIIILEFLLPMSITIKSTGTIVICNSIIIFSILPNACLVESSASKRLTSHYTIFLSRSSKSYNSLDITQPLDSKSDIA
jgi:hypothetical protein